MCSVEDMARRGLEGHLRARQEQGTCTAVDRADSRTCCLQAMVPEALELLADAVLNPKFQSWEVAEQVRLGREGGMQSRGVLAAGRARRVRPPVFWGKLGRRACEQESEG